MGIRAAIEALAVVVTSTVPITEPGVRFTMLADARSKAPSAPGRKRVCDLVVAGDEGSTASGFHLRRRYEVVLEVQYPNRGKRDDSALHLEDASRLSRSIALSNVTAGQLLGVATAHPTTAPEFEEVTPDGADAPTGVVMRLPFIVETREAEPT